MSTGTPSASGTFGFFVPELCKKVTVDGEVEYVIDALRDVFIPEVMTDKPDVFAAGMVALLWHVDRHPDKMRDIRELDKIASFTAEDLDAFLKQHVNDPALASFLRGTLHPDPAKRWTALRACRHRFIRDAVSKVCFRNF